MQVEMLKSAFRPGESKTRTILTKGSVVELSDEQAEILIEKGVAKEFEPAAQDTTPSDKWTVAELNKYAEGHKIDISAAKNKKETLALIQAATTTA